MAYLENYVCTQSILNSNKYSTIFFWREVNTKYYDTTVLSTVLCTGYDGSALNNIYVSNNKLEYKQYI